MANNLNLGEDYGEMFVKINLIDLKAAQALWQNSLIVNELYLIRFASREEMRWVFSEAFAELVADIMNSRTVPLPSVLDSSLSFDDDDFIIHLSPCRNAEMMYQRTASDDESVTSVIEGDSGGRRDGKNPLVDLTLGTSSRGSSILGKRARPASSSPSGHRAGPVPFDRYGMSNPGMDFLGDHYLLEPLVPDSLAMLNFYPGCSSVMGHDQKVVESSLPHRHVAAYTTNADPVKLIHLVTSDIDPIPFPEKETPPSLNCDLSLGVFDEGCLLPGSDTGFTEFMPELMGSPHTLIPHAPTDIIAELAPDSARAQVCYLPFFYLDYPLVSSMRLLMFSLYIPIL
ncbi:hypothetical protein BVC80_7429g1 [Macleaya cordata]|uniref:Uncharacterized protein n=1 Tax=Macleaya cordata TaxID=56857 RepID=A0A200QSL9_MACCD|nr:hypothetical protein BVC80_7429g1 [Macleaya cordata]